MNKCLYLDVSLISNGLHLRKAQLSGRYNSGTASLLKKFGTVYTGHCLLCAGMKLYPGEFLPYKAHNTKVLNDHSIKSSVSIGKHKVIKLTILIFFDQRVDCHIYLFIMEMGVGNSVKNLIPVKIVSIGSCTKFGSAQINGVSTRVECSHHCFISTSR